MKIIRKPTCKYNCWLPKAERTSRSHNVTPILLMQPLTVWVHVWVQFAISVSLLVLLLHPGAENALIPSGPSKLELSSRDATAQNLSTSHSGKSNIPRTTNTWVVCSAFWKKDQRFLSVFHKCGSLAEFRVDIGLSRLWWQTALEMTDIRITACWRKWLSGNMLFLIQSCSRAWTMRGVLLCRWTPLLASISCFSGCRKQCQSHRTVLLYAKISSQHKRKVFFPKCSFVH